MSYDVRPERLFDTSPGEFFDAFVDHTDAGKGADDG